MNSMNSEDHGKRVAEAADAVKAAKAELERLEGDTVTSPAALASKRLAARELLAIAQERHAKARIAAATAQALEWNAKAQELRRQAEELNAKAQHARLSAEGQIDGIYGLGTAEMLRVNGRRPVKAVEMETEAANLIGHAQALEADARSVGG